MLTGESAGYGLHTRAPAPYRSDMTKEEEEDDDEEEEADEEA